MLLSFLLRLLISLTIASIGDAQDSVVLLRFKSQIDDPMQTLETWNDTTASNFCQWEGVTCSAEENKSVHSLYLHSLSFSLGLLATTVDRLPQLVALHISNSNFTGPFDASLKNCSLEVLDMSSNNLSSSFPYEDVFEECKGMKVLNLSNNQLNEIRVTVSETLEKLDLSYNKLNTLSPMLFKTCKSLQYLDISHNHFRGNVPVDMLNSCINLENISIAYNNFSGSFPYVSSLSNIKVLDLASNSLDDVQIEGCSNLTELDLSFNKISRRVFYMQYVCASLKVLNISTNYFSGTLTSTLGISSDLSKSFPSLEVMNASHNKLMGEVPVFGTKLRYLDLSSNGFNSTPNNLCSSSSELHSLILPNNKLVTDVLNSLMNCASLEMLDLSFNGLVQEIPQDLCDYLPKLRHILVWANELGGAIPSNLGKCTNLTTLVLSFNKIKGAIPAELSQLQKLYWLGLSSNRLTGGIPSSFGRLKNLRLLQLSSNSLDSEIPIELADCERLLMIELAGNSLTGKIPPHLGRSKAEVQLFGATPVESHLGTLRFISPNRIPDCQGNFNNVFGIQGMLIEEFEELFYIKSGCLLAMGFLPSYTSNISSPQHIDVSNNKLVGEIPKEIGTMLDLLAFKADHNSLTGAIPQELANLRDLIALVLSYNRLQGSIPFALTQLSFLSTFNVSHNNLSGPVPSSGMFALYDVSSYEGNPGLCGLPLSTTCKENLSTVVEDPGDDDDDVLIVSFVSGAVAFILFASGAFYLDWVAKLCTKYKSKFKA